MGFPDGVRQMVDHARAHGLRLTVTVSIREHCAAWNAVHENGERVSGFERDGECFDQVPDCSLVDGIRPCSRHFQPPSFDRIRDHYTSLAKAAGK